jgi:hypothetical protein
MMAQNTKIHLACRLLLRLVNTMMALDLTECQKIEWPLGPQDNTIPMTGKMKNTKSIQKIAICPSQSRVDWAILIWHLVDQAGMDQTGMNTMDISHRLQGLKDPIPGKKIRPNIVRLLRLDLTEWQQIECQLGPQDNIIPMKGKMTNTMDIQEIICRRQIRAPLAILIWHLEAIQLLAVLDHTAMDTTDIFHLPQGLDPILGKKIHQKIITLLPDTMDLAHSLMSSCDTLHLANIMALADIQATRNRLKSRKLSRTIQITQGDLAIINMKDLAIISREHLAMINLKDLAILEMHLATGPLPEA